MRCEIVAGFWNSVCCNTHDLTWLVLPGEQRDIACPVAAAERRALLRAAERLAWWGREETVMVGDVVDGLRRMADARYVIQCSDDGETWRDWPVPPANEADAMWTVEQLMRVEPRLCWRLVRVTETREVVGG